MTLAEVGLIAIALGVFLFLRSRKNKKKAKPASRKNSGSKGPSLKSQIDALVLQTRDRLKTCSENETLLLEARIGFLESEAALLNEDSDQDSYWQSVTGNISSLLPKEKKAEEPLAELDELDPPEDLEPLDDDDEVDSDDLTQQEISRLRKIISKQHNAIDELKRSLQAVPGDSDEAKKLAKQLEQVEVAHAQLNMCVSTLDKENKRLRTELKELSEGGSDNEILQETKQKLDMANVRIDDLEEENSKQVQRIHELENEITKLNIRLKEAKEDLRRAEVMSNDLSRGDDDEPITDPEIIKKQIEDITELLMNKSDELQRLQNGEIPTKPAKPKPENVEPAIDSESMDDIDAVVDDVLAEMEAESTIEPEPEPEIPTLEQTEAVQSEPIDEPDPDTVKVEPDAVDEASSSDDIPTLDDIDALLDEASSDDLAPELDLDAVTETGADEAAVEAADDVVIPDVTDDAMAAITEDELSAIEDLDETDIVMEEDLMDMLSDDDLDQDLPDIDLDSDDSASGSIDLDIDAAIDDALGEARANQAKSQAS